MSTVQPQERSWVINGLKLHGLSWGEEGGKPLMCLHGWLDNAASFSLLAPLLPGCHLVALDLTGHGRSSWRSADASYQIWDDLPEILGVMDALGWERCNLLGHSRGAIISGLLASSQPERVQRLVLLDAITPQPLAEPEFPAQIAKFVSDKKRLLNRSARLFDSVEQAIDSRIATGLTVEAATLLATRNLRPRDDGYTWSTDPRLRGASAVKLTAGQIQAVLAGLCMPGLLLVAEQDSSARYALETARRHAPGLHVEQSTGGHHFHMEPGVAGVARRIAKFLELETE